MSDNNVIKVPVTNIKDGNARQALLLLAAEVNKLLKRIEKLEQKK